MIEMLRQRPRQLALVRQVQYLVEISAFMPRVEIGIWSRIVFDPAPTYQPNISVAHDVLACQVYAMVFFSLSAKSWVPSGKDTKEHWFGKGRKSPICERASLGPAANSIALSL